MASGNALAFMENGEPDRMDLDGDRPAKRSKLAADAVASIQFQTADAETSLEVDLLILDYLVFQTISACLSSRMPNHERSSSVSLSKNLAMSDAFLSTFKTKYPRYKPDAELRFRLVLCKLTALYTQRLTANPTIPTTADLQAFRAAAQERTRAWIGQPDRIPSSAFATSHFDRELPLEPRKLDRNRAHVLNQLQIPAENDLYEDAFYGTAGSISLLDVIPLFMQVSATRNAMSNSHLSDGWMQLACQLMLQACLEQYLVFGAEGTDAIDVAFAWGYKGSSGDVERDADQATQEINDMFEHEEYEMEDERWAEVKSQTLKLLLSLEHANDDTSDSLTMVSHLESLAADHPIRTFEGSFLEFLSAMSESIPKPILAQLELGELDGMSQKETEEFVVSCGIDPAVFCRTPGTS